MVVSLGGYGWYLLDMDGIWNSVDAVQLLSELK